jgi:hypothetical protein
MKEVEDNKEDNKLPANHTHVDKVCEVIENTDHTSTEKKGHLDYH